MKHILLFALMLLSLLSFAQEPQTKPSATYLENEFIIWLEQGVDVSAFAVNSGVEITPKRLLSERLNIWLFEISDSKEPREDKMRRLAASNDVRVIQNNHTVNGKLIFETDVFHVQLSFGLAVPVVFFKKVADAERLTTFDALIIVAKLETDSWVCT